MSLFITQCPHCHTAFRTSISQLQSADGMVRCGACLKVFVADDNLLPSADLRTISRPMPAPEEEDRAEDGHEEQMEIEALAPADEETAEADVSDSSIFTLDLADSVPNRISPSISEHSSFWEILDADTLEPLPRGTGAAQDANAHAVDDEEHEDGSTQDPDIPLDGEDADAQDESDEWSDEEAFSEASAVPPLDDPAQPTDSLTETDAFTTPSDEEFEYAFDDDPEEAFDDAPETDREQAPEDEDDEVATLSLPPQASSVNEDAAARTRMRALRFDDDILDEGKRTPALSEDDINHVSGADTPLELDWQEKSGAGRYATLFTLLSLLLVISLGLQWLWFSRDSLSQSPRWRPLMDSACAFLHCELPELVDIRSIHSEALEVRSHPDISNALSVHFIFRNDAGFAQPFPGLYLRFTDADDAVVAERRFLPREYLPEGVASLGDMPPGSPVQVALAILDPGPRAVNYEVSFYAPAP